MSRIRHPVLLTALLTAVYTGLIIGLGSLAGAPPEQPISPSRW